ncbi:MAG: hypothetical protein H7124_07910 [Phycisphaerales bacterium]|nr:hypothetical protein [Hyphomonadaceae bacterium]
MSNREIRLNSGRDVRLWELRQKATYEGLLEGLPTTRLNNIYLDRLIAEHQKTDPAKSCYLLAPQELPIELPPGETYPFGAPAKLPSVTCTGRFRSMKSARDVSLDYSELVVIWLQDEFAMPIASDVVEQIKALDWEKLAGDFEY